MSVFGPPELQAEWPQARNWAVEMLTAQIAVEAGNEHRPFERAARERVLAELVDGHPIDEDVLRRIALLIAAYTYLAGLAVMATGRWIARTDGISEPEAIQLALDALGMTAAVCDLGSADPG